VSLLDRWGNSTDCRAGLKEPMLAFILTDPSRDNFQEKLRYPLERLTYLNSVLGNSLVELISSKIHV
jgi:hypothetical protein